VREDVYGPRSVVSDSRHARTRRVAAGGLSEGGNISLSSPPWSVRG